MATILVTDCWTNKALSVVRSLGLANHTVAVLSHKRNAAAYWSGFVSQRIRVPNPANNYQRYLLALKQTILTGNYDLVIPLEENSIAALQHLSSELLFSQPRLKLAIPEKKSFEVARDKWLTLGVARKCNVPIPKTFLPQSREELDSAVKELGFPLIMKPRCSSGSRGVTKIDSASRLTDSYHSIKAKFGPPLLQQYIPQSGQALGVGLLARHGELLVAYSYKRLREFPVSGGPSTLRETTADGQVKVWAARLMKALEWTGLAMVEFKVDPFDGIPKLMEVNPRIWGSIELAQVAGINFPSLLYQMLNGEPVKQVEYAVGVRCRWLLPGDVAHFLANPQRFRLCPSFFDFWAPQTFYDDFKWYDLQGSAAAILCCALSVFDWETWKLGVFRR